MNSNSENSSYFFTWSAQKNISPLNLTGHGNFFYKDSLLEKPLWDLCSTSFQASFGLRPSFLLKALKEHLDSSEELILAQPKSIFTLKEQVTSHLLSLIGKKGKIFYTQSGSESVENALKMSRQISQKNYILAQKKSYHGASLGALSVTGDWRQENHFHLGNYTLRVPHPYEDPEGKKLKEFVEKNLSLGIAAFILEPVSGANGVYYPNKSWWKMAQSLSEAHNFFLILDEVVTGFYRTGPAFAFQEHPFLRPHFICLAKAITGGIIPFGAVWANQEQASFYDTQVLSCGLTNYAYPLGLRGLEAVLSYTQTQEFQQLKRETQDSLDSFVSQIKNSTLPIKEIRQKGMLLCLDFSSSFFSLEYFKNEGFYVFVGKHTEAGDRLILAPALTYGAQLSSLLNEFFFSLQKACT